LERQVWGEAVTYLYGCAKDRLGAHFWR